MRFQIFDVGHGFCAYAVARNGNVLVFDCGGDGERTPTDLLRRIGVNGIEYLFVTNYDEDHISDLPRLRDRFWVSWLYVNRSISAEELRRIKRKGGPLSEAMETLLSMFGTHTDTVSTPPPIPGLAVRTYCNPYPQFEDTNNLSLVTVLDTGNLRFLIPGDLETPGWRALLGDPGFRTDLAAVDVFIASHHGSDSGYCQEVFDYCQPSVIVLTESDVCGPTPALRKTYSGHAQHVQSIANGDLWWEMP